MVFEILKKQGLVNVYAGITLPNEASARLHEKCGFELFVTYENVGYKLVGWKSVGWWKLQLNEYQSKPAPPLKFAQLDQQWLVDLFERTTQRIQSEIIE